MFEKSTIATTGLGVFFATQGLIPTGDETHDSTPENPHPGANASQTILHLPSAILGLTQLEDRRQLLLESILASVDGERAFLLERSEAQEETWEAVAARTFEGEEILNPTDKIIQPLLLPCAQRKEGYFTANLEQEQVFEQLVRARQPRTRSLLILPFPDPHQMIYVDHRFKSLELAASQPTELAWLYTLLVTLEQQSRDGEKIESVEEEAKALRRQLKERRKPTATPDASSGGSAIPQLEDSRGLRGDFSLIVGQSEEVIDILKLLDRVAPTNAPVLINGESGTGKELIARCIHINSPRHGAPIVSENCGALTETLLESELFGYVKGAFTGAYEDREGLFETANGGTLFLDEIGDTSPGLQKKLLRVLQEGHVRRVGGSDLIPVDVRILSATNKDLMTEVKAGRFREDLFYRLNVINVILPALRERREDIPLLVEYFVRALNSETPHEKHLSQDFLNAICEHSWPGNIRELQNEVRRAFTLSEERLDPAMLSARVLQRTDPNDTEGGFLNLERVLELGSLKEATEELERRILATSLRRFHSNKAQICAELQIPKTTLYSKLRKYGLDA